MLQQDEPDDYVIATGETHSVREFVETVFGWSGSTGSNTSRSTPATSAPPRSTCSWAMPPKPPRCSAGSPSDFADLVRMMVESDLGIGREDVDPASHALEPQTLRRPRA